MRLIESSARDQSIVNLMVALAQERGFKVVAEGVETQYQQDSLRTMGCDFFQGYLYSKPLPAAEYHDHWLVAATPMSASVPTSMSTSMCQQASNQ